MYCIRLVYLIKKKLILQFEILKKQINFEYDILSSTLISQCPMPPLKKIKCIVLFYFKSV